MFRNLGITQEQFERSQAHYMNDPHVSMELFNLGVSMEAPLISPPTQLTAETTVQLVIKSNEFAYGKFESTYVDQTMNNPQIIPILISTLAYDWVKTRHGFTEEEFKAALYKHKIYENATIQQHMQEKQAELLTLVQRYEQPIQNY